MEPGLKRCVEMQERDACYILSTTLIFSFQAILRRCLLKSTVSVILLYFDFLVSHLLRNRKAFCICYLQRKYMRRKLDNLKLYFFCCSNEVDVEFRSQTPSVSGSIFVIE